MTRTFNKTEKQSLATAMMSKFMFILLYGGSRSGKTFLILRNIVIRACKVKSRHVIVRLHFNHLKASIIYDTLPKVFELCFPNLPPLSTMLNKSDWFVLLPNGSQIWFCGLDDKIRTEKVLGTEYSTIYFNESSQLSYDSVIIGLTRLAENVGLKLKAIFDCNPPGKRHWLYKLFIKKEDPVSGEKIKAFGKTHSSMRLNPIDNKANLSKEYFFILEGMPKRKRQRFLDGLFLDDTEGALWTDQMVDWSHGRKPGDLQKTVVALDPSTTNNKGSDECGILVCSKDDLNQGVVQADLSGKMSTQTWAQVAVNAYEKYGANEIVAEVNQGGDLVKDAIKNIDKNVKVVTVHASKSKKARAEPVSQLYEEEQKRIIHLGDLVILEDEITSWVPEETKESPNRLDALTWGMTRLFFGDEITWNLF